MAMDKLTLKICEAVYLGLENYYMGKNDRRIENDPENREYPPDNGYSIRNGYDTTDEYDPCNNHWNIKEVE